MIARSTDTPYTIGAAPQNKSTKLELGATDARGITGYIPVMNLLQSEKSLSSTVRNTLNWVLTGISVASNMIFLVLKFLGIGVAILSGPIGWIISAGLLALSVVLSLIAYKIASRDPEAAFKKTGYQLDPIPFHASNFSAEDKKHIRFTSELCEKLAHGKSQPVSQNRTWPNQLANQQIALQKAGFEFVGGSSAVTLDNGQDIAVHRFENAALGIGFAIAVEQNGATYFLPTLDTNRSERLAALACAACPWQDARTEAFDAAFQNVLMAYGDDVIPAGSYIEGMFAQFLGLKYGCKAFCYNPYGIGPVHQQIIGQARMAKNATQVYSFIMPKLQTRLQKFANVADLPLTFLTGYQNPGVFGQRFKLPDPPCANMHDVVSAILSNDESNVPTAGEVIAT
ncbi:MAG: hypothetical protein LBD72_00440 [Puniceicoccales bacterium]|jgi:hypothetical protein|nr:hypothetical protein [Puniceicoccales bacterium]